MYANYLSKEFLAEQEEACKTPSDAYLFARNR